MVLKCAQESVCFGSWIISRLSLLVGSRVVMHKKRHKECSPMGCVKALGRYVLLSVLLISAPGCAILSRLSDDPATVVETKAGDRTLLVSPVVLQGKVMRFADEYIALVAHAVDGVTSQLQTPEVRLEATWWKVNQANAAIGNAAGVNPVLNALDMIMLASASRMVVEDYWAGIAYGEAARPLLEAHRLMETQSWSLVEGWVTDAQKQDLQELIMAWRKENPQQRQVAGSRIQEFSESLGRRSKVKMDKTPTSLFSLFGLDPLASLDPARQEIEKTRQTAERVLFYGQHLPMLLNWQAELLSYQLACQPESRQILSNANQFADSADRFTKTVEQLPRVIDQQREAAIQQVFDNLKREEKQARELLDELRATLAEGTAAATNITVLVRAIDTLLAPSPPVTNHVNVSSGEKGHPFDIRDWRDMLVEATAAAGECNQLMGSINHSMPAIQVSAVNATGQLLDHVLRVGLILIAALLVAALSVVLAIRKTRAQ